VASTRTSAGTHRARPALREQAAASRQGSLPIEATLELRQSARTVFEGRAESFFATLKRELVNRRSWPSLLELQPAVFERIKGFYNPQASALHPRDALPGHLRTATTLDAVTVETNRSNNNNQYQQHQDQVSRKPGQVQTGLARPVGLSAACPGKRHPGVIAAARSKRRSRRA
jgi:hypothetical protein